MKQRTLWRPSGRFFDGGVSNETNKNIINKVGSGNVIQIAERLEEGKEMKWKTVVEVARVLPNEVTITEGELMAASDAARAVCCLIEALVHPF